MTGYAVAERLDPWGLRFEARAVAGRLVLTELTVTFLPNPAVDPAGLERGKWSTSEAPQSYPESGIDSAVLENVNHGQLLSAIYAKANENREVLATLNGQCRTEEHLDDDSQAAAQLVSDAGVALSHWASDVQPRRRGNPGFLPSYLRHVAEVRLQVEAEGFRSINAEVANRLDLPDPERARDHVNAATRARWLMRGTPGRSQRLAGPKLLALREAEEAARNNATDQQD